MPRQARIDISGQMYHVMSRGMERGKIFLDEKDSLISVSLERGIL